MIQPAAIIKRTAALLAALPLLLLLALPAPARAEDCTTAVVSGAATPDGRPLLWKNRDIDNQNVKLAYISDGPLAAVGLVNVGGSTSIWMGVNEAGFAIENSNSEDLEGTSTGGNGSFERQALLTCATVDAFEALLVQTNATGRSTKANYGVIDATGAAAMFEVGNHTYRRYDATDPEDAPMGFIVRTNFALTGDGSGTGQVRYDRAVELLNGAALAGGLTHDFLLRHAVRDLKNDAIDPYPLPYESGQDGRPAGFIRTVYSINRTTTVAAAVFRGIRSGEAPGLTTMWTILGEPVCSVALPVWPLAGAVPADLGGTSRAPLCDAAIVRKDLCYTLPTSPDYIDTKTLDDGLGGGVFAWAEPIEDWALARAEAALAGWRLALPTPQAVAGIQDELARQAYWCVLASSAPNDALSAPRDLALRRRENRSLILREYVHVLTWLAPASGSPAAYRIYDVTAGGRTLLAEVPAGTLSYLRRGADRTASTAYAVLAVDATGAEGSPACLGTGAAAGQAAGPASRAVRPGKAPKGTSTALRKLVPAGA